MSHHAQLLLLHVYVRRQRALCMPLCPHAELMTNKMSSSSFCINCNAMRPTSTSSYNPHIMSLEKMTEFLSCQRHVKAFSFTVYILLMKYRKGFQIWEQKN
jgi:hypothetical protein